MIYFQEAAKVKLDSSSSDDQQLNQKLEEKEKELEKEREKARELEKEIKVEQSRLQSIAEENEDLKKLLSASETAVAEAQTAADEVDELNQQIDDLEEKVDNLSDEKKILTSTQVGSFLDWTLKIDDV